MNSKLLYILSIVSFIFSCRQIPEEEKIESKNISSNEPVSVRIDYLGEEWENEIISDVQDSEYQSIMRKEGNYLINNGLESYTEILDDDFGAAEVKEILESPENDEYLASLGLVSVVKDINLSKGAKYKVLAYKKTGNNYVFEKQQEFIVGKNASMKLNARQNYTLILFSNGLSNTPNVYNHGNLNTVSFDAGNQTILYQRIDNFVPNENINNIMNVKLKYKSVGIRIILDAADIIGGNVGKKITHISSANLEHTKAKRIMAKNGTVSEFESSVHVDFKNFGAVNNLIVSSSMNTFMIKNGDNSVFHVDIKTEDMPEVRRISIPLKNLKQGNIKTFRIKLKRCGAYFGGNKTNWRQFMCHNLGADYSKDPFVPSADIHGDKYQWGYKTPIIKQKDDVIKSDAIPSWNKTLKSNTWNKGMDDPCPSGYRIPTRQEWLFIMLFANPYYRIGSWNQLYGKSATTGVRVSNIMLPTAGGRDQHGATIDGMANIYYWAMDEVGALSYGGYNIPFVNGRNSVDALSVRCIKK